MLFLPQNRYVPYAHQPGDPKPAGTGLCPKRTISDRCRQCIFQQSLNAGGLPFQVTEDNAALIQAKALSRLMKELEAGLTDPVSYSEDDVYRMLGVEKEA